jgi:ABC-type phosphate transport system substrate-binding protein
MRLLALLGVLGALVAAGCGGAGNASEPQSQPESQAQQAAADGASQVGAHEPTPEQLAVRRELLREIAAGKYKCWCTAALRAKERIASGKVKAPPRDQMVSALP